MHNKKPISVDKADYCRVLITETLPYETPVIFSNDNFYLRCKNVVPAGQEVLKMLIDNIVKDAADAPKYTVPYLYKVRKNALEFRRLGLVHPRAQWRMVQFYERYERLIIYYCSKSSVSIRAPARIAGSYFQKTDLSELNQYKSDGVMDSNEDLFSKHASSFFAYKGYDRLHKFFSSNDFIALEKKWPVMWSMDVTKCFDSIYTHSITWATKEKDFIKKNVTKGVMTTFGNDFDVLMQKSNYNETNGIVIGPEISRIFAEMILQEVDSSVIEVAVAKKLVLGKDYDVRRYVDDIYLYAANKEVARQIFEVYANELQKFNLHINGSKTVQYERPFLTKKSEVINSLNSLINGFCDKFLTKGEAPYTLCPKNIISESRLSRSFIDSVKTLCVSSIVSYDEVSSYVIGAFSERIKRLINVENANPDLEAHFKAALIVLLELMFFFYTASPSVNASYKVCSSIILVSRFLEVHYPNIAPSVKQRIYELSIDLFEIGVLSNDSGLEKLIRLESVNIILSLSELGEEYLLPADIVTKVFLSRQQVSYFDVIVCLFYIRDHDQYETLRKYIVSEVESFFNNPASIDQRAENACLFLDLLSCPYIHNGRKVKWLNLYFMKIEAAKRPTKAQIYSFVEESIETPWFVDWKEIDLLNALERKELKRAY